MRPLSLLTRRELTRAVAGATSLRMPDAARVVEAIIETMTAALLRRERIEIRSFGAFGIRHRQPRAGRNPRTGRSVDVPAREIVFFKASGEILAALNAERAATLETPPPQPLLDKSRTARFGDRELRRVAALLPSKWRTVARRRAPLRTGERDGRERPCCPTWVGQRVRLANLSKLVVESKPDDFESQRLLERASREQAKILAWLEAHHHVSASAAGPSEAASGGPADTSAPRPCCPTWAGQHIRLAELSAFIDTSSRAHSAPDKAIERAREERARVEQWVATHRHET